MLVWMYISCNTLGSLEESLLTLENYCNHLSGHLESPVYHCIKICYELHIVKAESLVFESVISLLIDSLNCEHFFGIV